MSTMQFWSRFALLAGVMLMLSAVPWTPSSTVRAEGDEADRLPAMSRCAQGFAAALSGGDATALASFTHKSLLARIRVPAEAAKRRTYECFSLGRIVAPEHGPAYGTAILLARQSDGVEDFVTVTLKFEAGQWQVVGGPVGHTGLNPLDDQ